MKITEQCVVALAWVLQDGQGHELDRLHEPVEFLVGGTDLLASVERALQGRSAGQSLHLHLQPEDAFGSYDEKLVFLQPRALFPAGLEAGMVIEASALPAGCAPVVADALYTVSDVYPDHVVLDGNHPLAGMALQLHLHVAHVRAATAAELGRGSAGAGFFRVQPAAPASGAWH